jgi:hypothetical protein
MVLFISACKRKNKQKVEMEGADIRLEVVRLEKELFSAKNQTDFDRLYKTYPVFIPTFMDHIIGDITGGRYVSMPEKTSHFLEFVHHPEMIDLYRNCEKKYSDFSKYQKELTTAFGYYKHHFPKKVIPEIYTFVSPFKIAHPCFDSILGVGLDMYLGSDFEPYASPVLEFPQYFINKLRPDYLVPNAMKAWLMSEFGFEVKNPRFLDEIIHHGKIMYALDALLPDVADSLKIGYFNGQLEWCREQEFQIWENTINSGLLYNTERNSYLSFINDGPFTKGFGVPDGTPPKLGIWLGWQIVRKYMDRQEKVSLEQLMGKGADMILKESKYKP